MEVIAVLYLLVAAASLAIFFISSHQLSRNDFVLYYICIIAFALLWPIFLPKAMRY